MPQQRCCADGEALCVNTGCRGAKERQRDVPACSLFGSGQQASQEDFCVGRVGCVAEALAVSSLFSETGPKEARRVKLASRRAERSSQSASKLSSADDNAAVAEQRLQQPQSLRGVTSSILCALPLPSRVRRLPELVSNARVCPAPGTQSLACSVTEAGVWMAQQPTEFHHCVGRVGLAQTQQLRVSEVSQRGSLRDVLVSGLAVQGPLLHHFRYFLGSLHSRDTFLASASTSSATYTPQPTHPMLRRLLLAFVTAVAMRQLRDEPKESYPATPFILS